MLKFITTEPKYIQIWRLISCDNQLTAEAG